ncbi:TetR/AcrR family transcriptional regulator [Pelomonas sp. P7]|uniref:TetR/AcrR family transcriptional regulator n=1 Tax=Pelomonas caseinilytica TaxID=2906763 RepID=A0ABS8XDZ5_9BURK|nr:TetR/AcrR family transcriptional regulator [Pelomonas sp. P7]MCE4539134.1 TetR/AcrR family transcriptional regulator [Pelomonas sp. P7]
MSATSAQQRIHRAALQLFAERGVMQLNVSELAEAAGVARGTIYNNLKEPEALFERVAVELAFEMDQRVQEFFALAALEDPAARLASGIRLWIRHAHIDPHWGRFIARFSFSNAALQAMWNGPPLADVKKGMDVGRYAVRQEQLSAVAAMAAGTVIGSIVLVLEGHRTWRDAGTDAAELVLAALGVPREEARALATAEFPSAINAF